MKSQVDGMRIRATAAGLAALALFAVSTPAGAFNIFESIFGRVHREPPPQAQAYAPPAYAEPSRSSFSVPQRQARVDSGPASAFCVRSCDGHFFPVRAHPGLSAAQACHAFCPAAETRLYSGSSIDHATASDGSRYADLPNAFTYRKQIVAGCTCNGRDPFGLAQIDPKADPTLKAGDVVVTDKGPEAFTGSKTAQFTPVQDYSGFSKSARAQLSALKTMPANPGAPAPVVSAVAPVRAAARPDERRAQNDR